MNIVKQFCCLFAIIFCLSSCKNKAVDFNNGLVNIQKSVLKEVQDFGKKMKEANADSFHAASVKPEADEIALFISNKIKEAQNLNTPKDGENLKNAILKQLQFEKDIVDKIGRLSQPDISQEERIQIETEFLNSQDKANALEDSVRATQEIFAKKHQFKLEEK